MHCPHQHATGYVSDHQPAALAEKCTSVHRLAHRRAFNFFCKHGSWTYSEKIGSRKRAEESHKHDLGALERGEGNPLISRVRLSDIAGPKNHTGNTAVRQDRGVTEIIDAHRLLL